MEMSTRRAFALAFAVVAIPALEVEGLVGLFGLRSMPKELIERIGADIVAAAVDPAVSARLSATAQVVNPGGPGEFAASIEAQRARIAVIAQTLGIKPRVSQ